MRIGWRHAVYPGVRSLARGGNHGGGYQRRCDAPLPSRIRLVATVVPCSTRPTAAGAALRRLQRQVHTGQERLGRVARRAEGVLARVTRGRLTVSVRVMSVKVPPMSTAMMIRIQSEGIDIAPDGGMPSRLNGRSARYLALPPAST